MSCPVLKNGGKLKDIICTGVSERYEIRLVAISQDSKPLV